MSEVCVHGLGYIGLPTAAVLATHDHRVYGYDVNPEIRSMLRAGEVHLAEPGLGATVRSAVDAGRLAVVDDVRPADYHVICVPTPFDEATRTADLEYVEAAGAAIADHLRSGDTVVLESTVPPGTTESVLVPLLEACGLAVDEEVRVAHCPETVLPGDVLAELGANDRIVGGVDAAACASAARLYDSFVDAEIRTVPDPTVAEFVKLIQNTYRDANIAIANEFARLAADYGVDTRDAIALANRHPRVDILQPGPGVGGHCLPVDPWFLGHGSDELDLVAAARRVNDGMTGFVVELLSEALGDLADRKIAILGAAYKGDVADTRASPGLKLARELRHADRTLAPMTADGGAVEPPDVAVHDPHVTDPTLDLTDLETATDGADALVVATDHAEYAALDPGAVGERMRGTTAVDTKGVLERAVWRRAGFTLRRI